MNIHQCVTYWYSFVISPNNTPWYFGGLLICEFPHFGAVF